MSKNMCKWRHKMRNGLNSPHESPSFRYYIFLRNFIDNLGHYLQVWNQITKTVFSTLKEITKTVFYS